MWLTINGVLGNKEIRYIWFLILYPLVLKTLKYLSFVSDNKVLSAYILINYVVEKYRTSEVFEYIYNGTSAVLLWHVLFWLHTPVFSEHSIVCTIVLEMKIKQLIIFLTFSVLLLAHVTALCELHKILPCWWRVSLAELGMQIALCVIWERYSLWAVVSFRPTKHRLDFSLDLHTYLVILCVMNEPRKWHVAVMPFLAIN